MKKKENRQRASVTVIGELVEERNGFHDEFENVESATESKEK